MMIKLNAFLPLAHCRLLLICFILTSYQHTLFATVYTCSTVNEIRTAMSSAVAGDEIVIVAGTYTASNTAGSGTSAHFYGSANGTASNPITIRSQSASNPATLKGNSQSSLTVLRIVGNYWVVKDLKITNAQKGLIFDNANHCEVLNCEVYDIGFEGIHVRDGSDYTLIDGCTIYNTGTVNAGFGEGIYIGTDKGSWSTYDPYVDYTTVKNCIIGPDVRAEAFDIKEGTQETIVEYCTVDADGISGSNFADSFVDLKGIRSYIRYNTFNRSNDNTLNKGIAVIDRGVALSSYEHAVHDNIFNMDAAGTGNMVEAYGGTSDVYAWNNTRNPSGDDYNSRVTTSCCPPWYNPGSGGTCNAPAGLSTSGITETAVTFNWSSVSGASNYDIRYRVDGTSNWTNISNVTGTSHTRTGLTASTTYEWQIRTSCSGTNSSYASGSNFTTNSSAPSCSAPSGLSTSGITSSEVTFNWSSVSGASNYDIRYREDGTSTWSNISNVTGTSHTRSGLSASTTYEWQIRTSCSGSNSSYASGSNFTTSSSGGGGTTSVVYDDALGSGWNNYSYSGTYNFSHTTNVQVGSNAIQASYNSWGGLLIKDNDGFNLSGFSSIRFWVKGAGNYQIRLKLDSKKYEFTTTTSWQQMTIPLSEFDNPSSVDGITFQNRSSSSRTVYYDQIEFVGSGGSLVQPVNRAVLETYTFDIFPNPVNGGPIQIRLNQAQMSGRSNLRLIDLMGRTIFEREIEIENGFFRDEIILPAHIIDGMYVIRIEKGGEFLQKRVLIKQN